MMGLERFSHFLLVFGLVGALWIPAVRGAEARDPYVVLGLQRGASIAEIKSAFRKAAISNHPDRGGSSEKFMEVYSAYDTLMKQKVREGGKDAEFAYWRPDVEERRDARARRYEVDESLLPSDKVRRDLDGIRDFGLVHHRIRETNPLSYAVLALDRGGKLNPHPESFRIWWETEIFPWMTERQERFFRETHGVNVRSIPVNQVMGALKNLLLSETLEPEDFTLAQDLISGVMRIHFQSNQQLLEFAEGIESRGFVDRRIARAIYDTILYQYDAGRLTAMGEPERARRLLAKLRARLLSDWVRAIRGRVAGCIGSGIARLLLEK